LDDRARKSPGSLAILAALLVGAAGCGTPSATLQDASVHEPFDSGHGSRPDVESPDANPQDLACGDAAACTTHCTGTCALVTLATGQASPIAMTLDSNYVYWADMTSGEVMKAPVGGGSITLLASGQNGPKSIAVDAQNVYWADLDQSNIWTGNGALVRVSLAGGSPTTLVGPGVAGSMGQKFLMDIALDSTHLYWTAGSDGSLDGGTVESVSLGGGTPVTLVQQQVFPTSITRDSSRLYWVTDQAVVSMPLRGGRPTTLATRQYLANGIAVASGDLYWTIAGDGISCGTGLVMSVPVTGGKPKTLASGQDFPAGIAADSESVYWVNQVNPGAVMKVARAGGAPTPLACGQALPTAIAVDGASVFWTNLGSVSGEATGSVMKRTPK
jgi:hypothetical protein